MASRVGGGVCASALAPAVATGTPSRKQWMHIGCGISRTTESCVYRPVYVPVARVGSVRCDGCRLNLIMSVTGVCYLYCEIDEYGVVENSTGPMRRV